MNRIGFMQGRLVNQINGKIQAFPWQEWQLEFPRAAAIGLTMIEWTLDDQDLEKNPLLTAIGQAEIRRLSALHNVSIPSITGDCFMQAPFWKCDESVRAKLLQKLDLVLEAASTLNISYVVIPLVDNGCIENAQQKKCLLDNLLARLEFLTHHKLQVVFETDYPPEEYREFLQDFPSTAFNVNYDIGNSASLGFDPAAEFASYGKRIVNVHVKDRLLGGTTVPLGTGAADFDKVFAGLANLGYSRNYILQTARASDGEHSTALSRYAAMTKQLLDRHHGS
ncbi:MAG: TIM barrel protein [Azonexus sp.]